MAKKKREDRSMTAAMSEPFNNPFAELSTASGRPEVREEAPPELKTSRVEKIVLRREKKGRGGKTVTFVEGLSEPEALAKVMAKAMGCGASVEEGQLILQGDQTKRAASWLEDRGYSRVVIGN